MGGYVAQSVIKRFTDLVRALVAVDSSPYGEKICAIDEFQR